MKQLIVLFTVFMFSLHLASTSAMADPVGRDMGCSPTVANPCSGGSTGGGSGGSSAGAAIGQALGQALGEALRGNPEEDARRKAAAEAARRRAEEQARKEDEEKKNRLLNNMMDVGDSSQLGYIGINSGSGFSQMTDDQVANPSSLSPNKTIQPNDQTMPQPKSEGFTKGFEDASQCFSRNSSSRCAGLTTELQQMCLDDYRAGYSEGDKQRARLMQEAMQTGQQAGERGELADGASNPLADGPCRIDWITTYNKGYFQGKHVNAD